MVSRADVFEVTSGQEDGAVFYPAHVPMIHREHPGLAFTLAPARPWQWTGPGGPADATLTDVLAAVNYARVTGHPWAAPGGMTEIHQAHQDAAALAAAAGDAPLAARLHAEQAEVAVPALVAEEIAAKRLGITGKSLNNLRLQYKTICPPVLIAGTGGPAGLGAGPVHPLGTGPAGGRLAQRQDHELSPRRVPGMRQVPGGRARRRAASSAAQEPGQPGMV